MSVIGSNILAGASGAAGAAGYKIERSLRFDSDSSSYFSRTPSSAGNRKTWTWSGWVKLGATGVVRQIFAARTASSPYALFYIFSDDTIRFSDNTLNTHITAAVYRDPSAWYHIQLAVDTTDATAGNRVRLWVNGALQAWATTTAPTQDTQGQINAATAHSIGSPQPYAATEYFDGYLAEIHFIDGQALDASSFGEYDDNNVWQPKEYSGTYGTNGFYLDFSDTSSNDAIGTDSSNNNNDWTPNNINGYIGDGTVYSTSLSTNTSIVHPASRAFDGVLGSYPYGSHSSGGYFLLSGVSIPYTTSLEVYKGNTISGVSVELNGSGVGAVSNNAWTTIATGSGTLTSLKVSRGGDSFFFDAIRIDGTTILVDDNAVDRDSMIDSPTNYTASSGNNGGNYAVFNPLALKVNQGTLENGNLELSSAPNYYIEGRSTIAASSFDNYSELTISSVSSSSLMGFAVGDADAWITTGGGSYLVYRQNGAIIRYPGNTTVATVASYTQGDVLGMAVDDTNAKFYKNGSLQGTYAHQLTGEYFVTAMSNNGSSAGNTTLDVNFGQRPFAYTPPTGFKSLCTTNLPDPTIADGSTAMDVALRTADTSQTTSVTGMAFSPDLIWEKVRNASSSHYLVDTVRGISKTLSSNGTGTESTFATYITSVNSDGYSVGTGDHQTGRTVVAWAWDAGANSSKTFTVKVVSDSGNKFRFDDFGTSAVTLALEEGSTYVFDQSDSSNATHPLRFSTTSDGTHGSGTEYTTGVTTTGTPGSAGAKTTIVVASGAPTLYYYCSAHSGMGGQANTNSTAGASNFDGSIQSTVRANASTGFSIVSVTAAAHADGSTVGHGLNAKPAMIIEKNRDATSSWYVQHSGLGDMSGSYILLNGTGASGTDGAWNLSEPTSSVMSIDPGYIYADTDANTIYYCWAPVEGYSAFGTYTGNASTDGPFVFLGFKPAVIIFKNADSSVTQWDIYDTTRDPDNLTTTRLFPSATNAENDTYDFFDVLSNGFKIRNSSAGNNGSGNTIIYAAWASNPFKTSRAH